MAAHRFQRAVRTIVVSFKAAARGMPADVVPRLQQRAESLLAELEASVEGPDDRAVLDDGYAIVKGETQAFLVGDAAEDDRSASPQADATTDSSPSTSRGANRPDTYRDGP
jgi:hypothetical protein